MGSVISPHEKPLPDVGEDFELDTSEAASYGYEYAGPLLDSMAEKDEHTLNHEAGVGQFAIELLLPKLRGATCEIAGVTVPLVKVLGVGGILHDTGKELDESQDYLNAMEGRVFTPQDLAWFQLLHCEGGARLIGEFQWKLLQRAAYPNQSEQCAVLHVAKHTARLHHTKRRSASRNLSGIRNGVTEDLMQLFSLETFADEVAKYIQICDGLQAMLLDTSPRRSYQAKGSDALTRDRKTPQQVYNILRRDYLGRDLVTFNGVTFSVLEMIRRYYDLPKDADPLAEAALRSTAASA
jgi:hypothetical protein